MRTENVLDYAEAVVGYPITVGATVVMDEETLEYDTAEGQPVKLPKGCMAIVRAISLEELPHQLTIVLQIFEDGDDARSFNVEFTEDDIEPHFPFSLPLTQEEIELERALAAEKEEAEAKKKADEAARQAREDADREALWQERMGGMYPGLSGYCH